MLEVRGKIAFNCLITPVFEMGMDKFIESKMNNCERELKKTSGFVLYLGLTRLIVDNQHPHIECWSI